MSLDYQSIDFSLIPGNITNVLKRYSKKVKNNTLLVRTTTNFLSVQHKPEEP